MNVLEDVTDQVRADDFMAQARRCRRLANGVSGDVPANSNRMPDEYEAKPAELSSAIQLAAGADA